MRPDASPDNRRPGAGRRGAAGRIVKVAASLGLLLLTSACVKSGITPKAAEVNRLFYFILWLALPVFVFVEGMLLVTMVRFRRRPGDDAEPRQNPGGKGAMTAFFAGPLAIVVVLLTFGEGALARVDEMDPSPAERLVITGFQWEWSAKYVDEDFMVTGKTLKTPMVIELPVNKTTEIELRSTDVIHEFYVPELLFMKNVVPGHPNVFTIVPTKLGTYHGQCAQFCGLWHSNMTFELKIVSEAEFQAWVQQQKQPVATNTGSCTPSGSAVTLVAEQISWDKECIAVTAGQPFQVTIDNRDKGIAHDFAIYTSSDLKNRLYLSPQNTGIATTTFTVPALPAGRYYFQCDVHGPAMAGTLVVG